MAACREMPCEGMRVVSPRVAYPNPDADRLSWSGSMALETPPGVRGAAGEREAVKARPLDGPLFREARVAGGGLDPAVCGMHEIVSDTARSSHGFGAPDCNRGGRMPGFAVSFDRDRSPNTLITDQRIILQLGKSAACQLNRVVEHINSPNPPVCPIAGKHPPNESIMPYKTEVASRLLQ